LTFTCATLPLCLFEFAPSFFESHLGVLFGEAGLGHTKPIKAPPFKSYALLRSYALLPFEFLFSTLDVRLWVQLTITLLHSVVLFTARVLTYKRATVTLSAINDHNVGAVAERADCVLMQSVQKVVYQETHVRPLVL